MKNTLGHTYGLILDWISESQVPFNTFPTVDKYICFSLFALHTRVLEQLVHLSSLCSTYKLCAWWWKALAIFRHNIFSPLTKLSTLHFGQKWAWHLKQELDLEPQLSLRSRSNSHGLDLEPRPSLRSRSNGRGLDLELQPSLIRSRSNSCRLDLEPQLSLRSRSNGCGLDLEPWSSLRSRSNGHRLDLEPWLSLRSRSNGCGLDLDPWLSLRSRSNGHRLDLDLQLSVKI